MLGGEGERSADHRANAGKMRTVPSDKFCLHWGQTGCEEREMLVETGADHPRVGVALHQPMLLAQQLPALPQVKQLRRGAKQCRAANCVDLASLVRILCQAHDGN
eukprot:11176919-Lingulodinium_polyedra.AAC.1